MTSGTTTVGAVKYDASIDLSQLRKSVAEADKIVEKSYQNQAKAAKKAAQTTGRSTGSNSSGGTTAYDAQARVNAIKREAQETAKTLATYSPQIQRQFLTVERANNQVANATVRSSAAIQQYGEGSRQATSATNALNVAVQNQSQQQSRLTAMIDGTYRTQNSFTQSMGDSIVAIGGVVASLAVLSTTLDVIRNSVKAANEFEASIAGLSRLSERFGYDAKDATAAAQSLAADGLVTVSTAANGLQKLLTAGVGLPEAIELMKGYKDQAAFGKSSTIDFNTAVGNLAESFYTENSAIGNLSGQTENWSRILEYGAAALGKNVSQLSAKERVQAKLIGQQRLNNLVEGDAALLAETSAGKQARLNQVLLEMQTTLGRVTNEITGGFIGALGGMDAEGQKMAIAFGAGVTAFVGFLTVVPLAITAFRTIRSALVTVGVASAFASGGITALLGGLVALGAGVAVSSLIDGLDTTEDLSEKFGANVNQAAGGLEDAAKNADKTAKQIAKINEQMQEARESYRYSLAELVKEKNENIATLRKTLSEEEQAYANAFNERKASFEKTQNEELLTHQQKTRALQNQIDFLTKYNTAANQKQLEELKFALARENEEHKKSAGLKKAEFDAETQSQFAEYEKRRLANQTQLDADLALLNKHREEIASVRNVMLRDQIENLQHQRDEQLKSLQQQARDARENGNTAGTAYGDAYSNEVQKATKEQEQWQRERDLYNKTRAAAAGKSQGSALIEGLTAGIKDGNWDQFWKAVNDGLSKSREWQMDMFRGNGSGGWATGGFTGRGGVHEPAGIVHRGEYVLPQDSVNQQTGLPDWDKILAGSGVGGSTNVTVHLSLSGIMTSSKADERAIATRIAKLINESVRSKTGKTAIVGV